MSGLYSNFPTLNPIDFKYETASRLVFPINFGTCIDLNPLGFTVKYITLPSLTSLPLVGSCLTTDLLGNLVEYADESITL